MTEQQPPTCNRPNSHHTKVGTRTVLVELREHVPFSVSAVAIGLIMVGTLCILYAGSHGAPAPDTITGCSHEGAVEQEPDPHDHSRAGHEGHVHPEADPQDRSQAGHEDHAHTGPGQRFFHLFHPAHMLFSAAATAAMFFRYERKVLKAIIVGLVGAIGVCGVSDIVMPHMSLAILGVDAPWHICIIEHPGMVLPFAFVGVLMGIGAADSVAQSTIISHSLHVLSSTMASIFYMVGPMGIVAWIDRSGMVFIFVVLAVMVPCCLSDIVFPLLMSKTGRDKYAQVPHSH